MTQAGPLLRVRDLSVTFPARRGRPPMRAVDQVSFDIEAGQTVGLVGESGSGKTTTGRAILQLQPVTACSDGN
jgi:oligopeptide transport system ATP-binding protein